MRYNARVTMNGCYVPADRKVRLLMSDEAINPPDLDRLKQSAEELMNMAVKAGADNAEVVISKSSSFSVNARLGKVETSEKSEDDSASLRVFIGGKVAAISSKADRLAVEGSILVERALAMAKAAPEDRFATLAPTSSIAKVWPDLDLYDSSDVGAKDLASAAIELESIALEYEGISNSNGSSAAFGVGGLVLAASNGFTGAYVGTHHSRSVSVVSGSGTEMERDYDYDSKRHLADLRSLDDIGKQAASRTLKRLNPRKVGTQKVPVIFDRRISSSVLAHLASAINGSSIARGSSFLKDRLGKQLFGNKVRIVDDPHLSKQLGSRPFDADGTSVGSLKIVDKGVLETWILDSYTARELGMEPHGRAAFSGSNTRPATTNLWMEAGDKTPPDMVSSMTKGMIVTDFIGSGVSMVTGDYSRGVTGFWVENGEIQFPVSELTLAGNLVDIFNSLVPADDLEIKGTMNAPSLYIEGLTLAGI